MVDIFGTGKTDLISVAAGAQLDAYAAGSTTPIVTYQVPGGVADIKATPIVVTDPRNGQKDLFAAMGRDENNTGTLEDGRVFGWNLQTGQLLPGWTNGISTGFDSIGQSGSYGPLTSGQLEGNGLPDIVVTSFSHYVTAYRLDGSTLWQWENDDTIVSGAVVGDIDRSGKPSVIVGGDSSASVFYGAGGWVNVLSNTGTLKWRHFIPGEVTWSSPVLGDLYGNGYLDIIIGTGLNYDFSGVAGARAAGNYIYALDPLGNILPGWPYHTTSNDAQAHEVLASPALADLLGNGQIDVIALDRAGYIHAIAPNGQDLPGFAGGVSLNPQFPPGTLPADIASPIVVDVNGDGRPDIVATYGPFIASVSPTGQVTQIATTNIIAPSTIPEGVDAAPAVGNYFGGPGLTMAVVSYNTATQDRPDQVQFFNLPPSTLAPPWPMQRRTVTGDAVVRSPGFDHIYINAAFYAALGYVPAPAVVQTFDSMLDSDTIDLASTSLFINTSTPARQAEVERVYQVMLGHAPDANSLNAWTTYLATNTYRSMEVLIASGPDFAARAQNALGAEIYYLYQTFFGRTPTQSEINAWAATGENAGQLATTFSNSSGAVIQQLDTEFGLLFGPGTQGAISAETIAAYSFDIHRGAREEVADASIQATFGQYGATNFLDSYTHDVYRDVLRRNESPAEAAFWVNAFDQNTVPANQLPYILLTGAEARANYVQQEFTTLLGRPANSGEVAAFQNYASREALIVSLVTSPEYYNRNGATLSNYIGAVYRDVGGLTPVSQDTISFWLKEFAAGAPLANLTNAIIHGGQLYFYNLAVYELQTYLPNEDEGVLRTGNAPPNAPGQPINPDPNMINYLVGQSLAGVSDEALIGQLLNTADYYGRVTYYKGIYRSPGIRN